MMSSNLSFSADDEVVRIARAVAEAGGRPVLVGGWVRDSLLGLPPGNEFDIEVFNLSPELLHKLLKRFGPVHAVGRHFGVLKLVTRQGEYDVSVPRRESKTGKGHKGFWVDTEPGMSFGEAAARRDFTINSMGYALLEEEFIDPFGGERDLRAGLLRHVGPAFGEDPLRVMRAMQFAGRFSLQIAPETVEICRGQELTELPRERMWDELKKLLLRAAAPSRGLDWAGPLGILEYYPELRALEQSPAPAGGLSPWRETMAVVDAAAGLRSGESGGEPGGKSGESGDIVLMCAALCHQFGAVADPAGEAVGAGRAAEATRLFLERLTNEIRLIGPAAEHVRELPQPGLLHQSRGAGSDSAVRRLALRISIPSLERLARACFLGLLGPGGAGGEVEYPAGNWLLERARALGVLNGPPEPLLKGRHLRTLGIEPGRAMGDILKEAFELQLDGSLTSMKEALKWAGERMAQGDLPEEERGR